MTDMGGPVMEEKKRSLKNYSKEFKLRAIREVLEDGKGLRETARAYQIRHGMLGKWIAAYMEYGEEGVRPSKATKLCDGDLPAPEKRPPKKPNAKGYIESELPVSVQNELRYLRMENAYLKKLKALVQNRE